MTGRARSVLGRALDTRAKRRAEARERRAAYDLQCSDIDRALDLAADWANLLGCSYGEVVQMMLTAPDETTDLTEAGSR